MNEKKFAPQKDIKGGWMIVIGSFVLLFFVIFYNDLRNISWLPVIAAISIFSALVFFYILFPY